MAKKSGGVVTIDGAKAAEGGGGGKRVPEGDYLVKITDTKRGESQSGNAQIIMTLSIQDGPKKNGDIRDYLTLTEAALWRVGALLDAIGMKYPKKAFKLDIGKLLGKELGVTVADDEYNGKIKSKVVDFLDLETIKGILEGGSDDEKIDTTPDYSDMSEKKLLKLAKKQGLKVKEGTSVKKLIKLLEEQDDGETLDEFDTDEL